MNTDWNRKQHDGVNTSAVFLAGLVIGGIAAALLTPITGRNLRKQIKSGARDGAGQLKQNLTDAIDSASSTASEIAAKGKSQVRAAHRLASDAIDSGVESYREAVNSL